MTEEKEKANDKNIGVDASIRNSSAVTDRKSVFSGFFGGFKIRLFFGRPLPPTMVLVDIGKTKRQNAPVNGWSSLAVEVKLELRLPVLQPSLHRDTVIH